MAGVSALGVGSGADFAQIVDDLVQAEGESTVLRLDAEEGKTTTKLSSYGILKSSLATFQSSVSKLKTASSFESYKSSTSNDDAFELALNNSSVTAATYNLKVNTLGVAHQVTSGNFADATNALGYSGELRLSIGSNQFTITVSSADSLNDIRDAINDTNTNTGMSAAVINTESNSVLVLSSKEAGTGNRITVEIVGDGDGNDSDNAGLSQLTYDFSNPGGSYMTETATAVDAQIELNGQVINSTTGNTFSAALDGVSITIKETTASTETFTISQDNLAVFKLVEDMVDSFNSSHSSLKDLGKFDPATGDKGVLLGDAILRTAERQIYSLFSDSYLSSTDTFNRLSDIGVEILDSGKLKLNDSKLSTALNTDFNGVKKFFSDADSGFAVKLDSTLDGYTSSSGIIQGKEDGLSKDLEDIADQRADMEEHLESYEQRLITQFTSLDIMLAQMKATSEFLDTQLKSLESLITGNKK